MVSQKGLKAVALKTSEASKQPVTTYDMCVRRKAKSIESTRLGYGS